MTRDDITDFLEKNSHIEIREDNDAIYCRNKYLPWYQADETRATRIDKGCVESMTADELMNEINKGLEIEQITRITGYFTKLSSWNKGKLAELRDRERVGGHFKV